MKTPKPIAERITEPPYPFCKRCAERRSSIAIHLRKTRWQKVYLCWGCAADLKSLIGDILNEIHEDADKRREEIFAKARAKERRE